jgi:hypothetical protein
MANIETRTATETVVKTETTTIIPQQNNTPILFFCCGSFFVVGFFLGGQLNRPPPQNNGVSVIGNANNVKIIAIPALPKIALPPPKNKEKFVPISSVYEEVLGGDEKVVNKQLDAKTIKDDDCVLNGSKDFDHDVAEQICRLKEKRRRVK